MSVPQGYWKSWQIFAFLLVGLKRKAAKFVLHKLNTVDGGAKATGGALCHRPFLVFGYKVA
jgi:hypothetical protein